MHRPVTNMYTDVVVEVSLSQAIEMARVWDMYPTLKK